MPGRGYFSATSGNVTDDMINEYINHHTDVHDGKSREKIRLVALASYAASAAIIKLSALS